MFHVEHSEGFYSPDCSTWNIAIPLKYKGLLNPRASKRGSGHRPGSRSGGSDTTNRPPAERNARAASRVSDGGPKPRLTTAAHCPAHRASRPTTAVSPSTTVTRSASPQAVTPRRSASVRAARRSTSRNVRSGRASASTNPGTPAPVPMSTTVPVTPSRPARNSRACSMTSSIGRSPRVPRRWASASTSATVRRPVTMPNLVNTRVQTMIARIGNLPRKTHRAPHRDALCCRYVT